MLKSSHQRDAILKELCSRYDHPTAEQLYLELKQSMPNLSLATVYRNLNLLESEGLVLRIKTSGGDRFDGQIKNHYHFTCEKCGSIIDIELSECDINSLPLPFGGIIRSHSLMYYGLCAECASKENE